MLYINRIYKGNKMEMIIDVLVVLSAATLVGGALMAILYIADDLGLGEKLEKYVG